MIIEKLNKKKRNTPWLITHGDSRNGEMVRLYHVWQNMKARCSCPSMINYHRYGGRGIAVCKEWKSSYTSFKKWALAHGYKDGLTIDRIHNDKGYYPDNCQWLTRNENTSKGNAIRRKLTFQDAENIRASNISQRKLAKIYNVTKTAIADIKHYKIYKKEYNNGSLRIQNKQSKYKSM